jgi:uncharacterized tellurite resistance protein B-like protein
LIVAFALSTVVGYYYHQYRRSPEKAWRDRVSSLALQAKYQVENDTRRLSGQNKQHAIEIEDLKSRAFHSFLATIPVDALKSFPRIGDGTVAKLQQAGYSTVASIRNANVVISGLGEKRLKDISNAVQGTVTQARERFAKGDCPQAVELSSRLASANSKHLELQSVIQSRIDSARRVIEDTGNSYRVACKVTFLRWFFKKKEPMVPQEMLKQTLPDLSTVTSEAEAHARQLVSCAASAQSALGVPERSSHEISGEALLEISCELAFAVARIDGRIARSERDKILKLMQSRSARSPDVDNRIKLLMAHYETAAIDVDACLRRIRDEFPPAQRQEFLLLANQVAAAAGQMNDREIGFLNRLSHEWDVPWNAPKVLAEPPASTSVSATVPMTPIRPSDPRAVLEIEPSVPLTVDLIRRQYNLLSERLALDKVQAMGMEFVTLAENKRAAIRAAGEALIKQFGEPLEPPEQPGEPAELRHNPDLDAMLGV